MFAVAKSRVARTLLPCAWIQHRLMDGGNATTVAPAPFVAAYCGCISGEQIVDIYDRRLPLRHFQLNGGQSAARHHAAVGTIGLTCSPRPSRCPGRPRIQRSPSEQRSTSFATDANTGQQLASVTCSSSDSTVARISNNASNLGTAVCRWRGGQSMHRIGGQFAVGLRLDHVDGAVRRMGFT